MMRRFMKFQARPLTTSNDILRSKERQARQQRTVPDMSGFLAHQCGSAILKHGKE